MVRSEFRYLSSDGHTALHAVEWLPNGVGSLKPSAALTAAPSASMPDVPATDASAPHVLTPHVSTMNVPTPDRTDRTHTDRTTEQPKAVLQIAHGIAEHILRYEPFAEYLTARGYAVVGNDHLGHGYSVPEGGTRLYTGRRGSWFRVVDDMETLRRLTAAKFPGVPYFLLGHSMGSFLVRTYLIRYPGTADAAVLMGTAQPSRLLLAGGLAVLEEECLRLGWRTPSALAARLAFGAYDRPFAPNRTSRDWLSVNRANVDAFLSSPLCMGTPAAGLLREMLSGMRFNSVMGNLRRMDPDTPVLFASGQEDPVGDMGAGVYRAAELFRRAGAVNVTVRLFPGLRHEILNEAPADRERVMEEVERFYALV